MKTLLGILEEYGEQLSEELENYFEDNELELRFVLNEEGVRQINLYRRKIELEPVDLFENPRSDTGFDFKIDWKGIK